MITGTFTVQLKPLETCAAGIDGVTLGRLSIDKTFSGALATTSQGEMLNVLSPVPGSVG